MHQLLPQIETEKSKGINANNVLDGFIVKEKSIQIAIYVGGVEDDWFGKKLRTWMLSNCMRRETK